MGRVGERRCPLPRRLIVAPHVATIPGLAIMNVVGFNLFGDGLRDSLDPQLRD